MKRWTRLGRMYTADSLADGASRVDVVRLYDRARSAHVERVLGSDTRQLLLFRRRSYDFLDQLPPNVIQSSRLSAVLKVARARPRVIEINEPAVVGAWSLVLPVTAVIRFLRLLPMPGATRSAIVFYAIENHDPIPSIAQRIGVPEAFVRFVWVAVCKWLFSTADRVAFGTEASRSMYAEWVPKYSDAGCSKTKVFPALEVARFADVAKDRSVVFLGAFEYRKGIDIVLEAWQQPGRLEGAHLTLIGKGELADDVLAFCLKTPSASVFIDPPRSLIRELLDAAAVLVLPSRTLPGWREQVGLPIVEALSAGCEIVTSQSTGLADWLIANGHAVLPESATPTDYGRTIDEVLRRPGRTRTILSSLPKGVSGRSAADRWLCA